MADLRIVDYTTLQAAILNTIDRPELADEVKLWIQLAEAEFIRQKVMRHKITARDVEATPTARLALPTDFLSLKLIQINADPPIEPDPVDMRELRAYQAAHPGSVGTPRVYAIDGDELVFPWAPDYPVEIVSFVRLAVLGDSNPTNPILDNAPDLYLYGSIKQGELFLKNDARYPLWDAKYIEARNDIDEESRQSERAPNTYVMKPRRVF